ncbi:MAG: alpha/beta hydrolase [Firmicutes bacterium]|nr:alpha/beta hydrolase [Bacillota bacterium]
MYFKSNDITIYYEKHGNKQKEIVILPGWGDTRKTWYPLIELLKEDFTVYILDYPGFSKSPFPNKDLTIYDYTELIYEWLKELNLKEPLLIGHSFGGRIIITLTGYYKYNFSDIILISSAGIKKKSTILPKIRNLSYKLSKKIANLLPKKIRNKYLNWLFSLYASDDYKNLSENMRQTFKNIISEDLTAYLKNISARCLLIWGNKDTSTPIYQGRIMHQKIYKSEFIELDNVGHFPYLEKLYLIYNIILKQIQEKDSY